MEQDEIPIARAASEFGVSEKHIRNAANYGVLRKCPSTTKQSKFFVSRSEIEEKIELIRRGDIQLLRLLNKGHRVKEREVMIELIEGGIRGKKELRRHGVPTIVTIQHYPRPVPKSGDFFCIRVGTWVPRCRIEKCRMKERCHLKSSNHVISENSIMVINLITSEDK